MQRLLLILFLCLPFSGFGQGYFDYLFFSGIGSPERTIRWNWSTRHFDSIPSPTVPVSAGVNDCYGQMLYYIAAGGYIHNHLLDTVVNYQLSRFNSIVHMPIKIPNSNAKFLLLGLNGFVSGQLMATTLEPMYNGRQGRISGPPQLLASGVQLFEVAESPIANEVLLFCLRNTIPGMRDIFVYSLNLQTLNIRLEDNLSRLFNQVGFMPGDFQVSSTGKKIMFTYVQGSSTSILLGGIELDLSSLKFRNPLLLPVQISLPLLSSRKIHLKNEDTLYLIPNQSSTGGDLDRLLLSTWDSATIMSSMTLEMVLPRDIRFARKYYNQSVIFDPFSFTSKIGQIEFAGPTAVFRDSVGAVGATHRSFQQPKITDLMLNADKPSIRLNGSCFGDTSFFAINDSDFVNSVYWDFGDSTMGIGHVDSGMRVYHLYPQPGIYQVRMISQYCNRIPDTTYKTVTILNPPEPAQLPDTTLCVGGSLPLSVLPQASNSIRWSNGDSAWSTNFNTGGWHWAEISNACFSTRDSFYITLHEPPQSGLLSDTNVCAGSSLTLTPQPGDYTWQWQDGSIQPLTVTAAGTYALLMTNACGTFVHEVRVDYQQAPELSLNDTSRCEGQFYRIELPEVWQGSYQWTDGSSERIRILTDSGWYSAEVSNPCGTTNDQFYLGLADCECHMYLPTAFSPNGDGLNDELIIKTRCELSSYQMEVYDRWGRQIFTSNNLNRGWDGTFQGQDVPNGSYPFIIRYTPEGRNPRVEKGVVNVLR